MTRKDILWEGEKKLVPKMTDNDQELESYREYFFHLVIKPLEFLEASKDKKFLSWKESEIIFIIDYPSIVVSFSRRRLGLCRPKSL
jgi:hypothetical protein